MLGEVIERAVQRGDFPTSIDEDLLIDLLIGPFYCPSSSRGIESNQTEKLVDFVLMRDIPRKSHPQV